MFLVQWEELRINRRTPLLVVTMLYACWFVWWADYPHKIHPDPIKNILRGETRPLSKTPVIANLSQHTYSLRRSRLKPSFGFRFEGLSSFSRSGEGLVQIQDVDLRI